MLSVIGGDVKATIATVATVMGSKLQMVIERPKSWLLEKLHVESENGRRLGGTHNGHSLE